MRTIHTITKLEWLNFISSFNIKSHNHPGYAVLEEILIDDPLVDKFDNFMTGPTGLAFIYNGENNIKSIPIYTKCLKYDYYKFNKNDILYYIGIQDGEKIIRYATVVL